MMSTGSAVTKLSALSVDTQLTVAVDLINLSDLNNQPLFKVFLKLEIFSNLLF